MAKNGRPYGTMIVEDYSESYKFMLFGKDYEDFRNYLFEGYSLLIKGVVQENPWKKDVRELEYKIKSMTMLANAREEMVKSLSLKMPLSELSDDIIEQIHNQTTLNKGKASLSFQIFDDTEGLGIEMFSRNTMIHVTNELVEFLEKNEIEYHVN
jgi:DNA polymerase-3 subunit alpha